MRWISSSKVPRAVLFIRMFGLTIAFCFVGISLSGCQLLQAGKDYEELRADLSLIEGEVSIGTPSTHPIVVVALRDSSLRIGRVANYALVNLNDQRSGSYSMLVEPGRYIVAAFEDANEDLVYQFGEGGSSYAQGVVVETMPGERSLGVDVHVVDESPAEGSSASAAMGIVDLSEVALNRSGEGKVIPLDDLRFGPETGGLGLWKPSEYLERTLPGVYLLEAYDPSKIPVVFVHGVGGSPSEFATIIYGRPAGEEGEAIPGLDLELFQPWVFTYPSAIRLARSTKMLEQEMLELRTRYDFESVFLVAHSMGGLVARSYVRAYEEMGHDEYLKLLLTIATPWRGHSGAESGVKHSPVVIPVWEDLTPTSDFISHLFDRPLPAEVPFHLLFTYPGGATFTLKTGDGAVELDSMLRMEAQEQAAQMFGFDAGHAEVLREPAAVARVHHLLTERAAALRADD